MTVTDDLSFRKISALVYALACVGLAEDDDKTEVIEILSEEITKRIRRLERSLAKHRKPAERPTAKLISLPGGHA